MNLCDKSSPFFLDFRSLYYASLELNLVKKMSAVGVEKARYAHAILEIKKAHPNHKVGLASYFKQKICRGITSCYLCKLT